MNQRQNTSSLLYMQAFVFETVMSHLVVQVLVVVVDKMGRVLWVLLEALHGILREKLTKTRKRLCKLGKSRYDCCDKYLPIRLRNPPEKLSIEEPGLRRVEEVHLHLSAR